ncbi:MAG: HAMP domain-containing protein [Rhodospirillaceae bacterium]|nr:HAMP domain-containing protein [Rhodospirillaceae bacterium]
MVEDLPPRFVSRQSTGGALSGLPVPRRRVSPLTLRLLALNGLALAILVGGLLYLDEYRGRLIEAEIESLNTQARMIAGAIGEGAVAAGDADRERLSAETARQILRRLTEPGGARVRMFAPTGEMIGDSRVLAGPGGEIRVEPLPPPNAAQGGTAAAISHIYDTVLTWLPRLSNLEPYFESPSQSARDYVEVGQALAGETASSVRDAGNGEIALLTAVPVQRYRQVLGALMLTSTGAGIDRSLRAVRLDILKIFAVVFGVTTLLSVYLAGTIARPIRRLAQAADQVRRAHGRQPVIPDFSRRGDEIGDLSVALRDMTATLWARLDAIESFAADVAHEIKNPLTSLKSAVETMVRVKDPEQQKKLTGILMEDLARIDRLITDIADASRLDAEMSRAESGAVDMGHLLSTLADIHKATRGEDGPTLDLSIAPGHRLIVQGVEDRLAQVFRNIIANAVSFSPPGGRIGLSAARRGTMVEVLIDDEGPGIAEGKNDAIFRRFYSERPRGEKFGTHSGLGLSISKQIVEGHGGTIAADNRRGAGGRALGARFVVRLPGA